MAARRHKTKIQSNILAVTNGATVYTIEWKGMESSFKANEDFKGMRKTARNHLKYAYDNVKARWKILIKQVKAKLEPSVILLYEF